MLLTHVLLWLTIVIIMSLTSSRGFRKLVDLEKQALYRAYGPTPLFVQLQTILVHN